VSCQKVDSLSTQTILPPFNFVFFAIHGTIVRDMEIVRTVLPYAQIILSILLVAAILLQQRGSSLGGAFGGDNFSAAYHKRRGAELFLFKLSVILGILFVASAFLNLVI
jgi:protein translocase SecG subunit